MKDLIESVKVPRVDEGIPNVFGYHEILTHLVVEPIGVMDNPVFFL